MLVSADVGPAADLDKNDRHDTQQKCVANHRQEKSGWHTQPNAGKVPPGHCYCRCSVMDLTIHTYIQGPRMDP